MSVLGDPIVLDFRGDPGAPQPAAAAVARPAAAVPRPAPVPRAAPAVSRPRVVSAPYLARAGAQLIDGTIVAVISLVLGTLLMVMLAPLLAAGDAGTVIFLLLFISFLPYALASMLVTCVYSVRLLSRPGARNGQTYGKQALELRVVRDDGRPMDGSTAAMREIVWRTLVFGIGGSLLFFIPTLLDYLWPLWDDRGRTLHDKAAGTYVVRAG